MRIDPDTDLGGRQHAFPATQGAVLRAACDADPAIRNPAFATLVASYWKPIYKYIRLAWHRSNEDAKDLTQAFFARVLEKDFLARYDPERVRFRTYLRVCLDGFLANEHQAAARLKRGGGRPILSLDFDSADRELGRLEPVDPANLDEWFRREWVRGLFELAVDSLREYCAAEAKSAAFTVFERYDLSDDPQQPRPTYAELAQALDLPVTQVTNYLAYARRHFRRLILEQLRTMTASDEEFQAEARQLFGD